MVQAECVGYPNPNRPEPVPDQPDPDEYPPDVAATIAELEACRARAVTQDDIELCYIIAEEAR